MAKFAIETIFDPDSSPFDRQERIEWWSQEKISAAKIMVVGAGAIGNETLKNLALLGVRNIFIADLDKISTSNLSRTVLFRKSDLGKKKAEVAAERTRELCLAKDPNIDWFVGDVVWELGTGIYREMDLVLGCLDNIETRRAINWQCQLAQTPWIDSGISELWLHVTCYLPTEPPCYLCGLNEIQRKQLRQRYSCDDFKRALFQEGKTPTVQIASSIASAIQVQEAMKYICGQPISAGKKISFNGKINDFDINQLPINPNCPDHVSYQEIIPLPLSSSISLREFLSIVSCSDLSGNGAVLDFRADRNFVISVKCRSCDNNIELFRPSFRIFDTETICPDCQSQGLNLSQIDSNLPAEKIMMSDFSLCRTPDRVLNMRLSELGVPLLHILTVRDQQGNERHYELSRDKEVAFPNIFKKESL
jgi:adenylyltransferase/sulfurtransferase